MKYDKYANQIFESPNLWASIVASFCTFKQLRIAPKKNISSSRQVLTLYKEFDMLFAPFPQ